MPQAAARQVHMQHNYAGIMLPALIDLLFSKLCWQNVPVPTAGMRLEVFTESERHGGSCHFGCHVSNVIVIDAEPCRFTIIQYTHCLHVHLLQLKVLCLLLQVPMRASIGLNLHNPTTFYAGLTSSVASYPTLPALSGLRLLQLLVCPHIHLADIMVVTEICPLLPVDQRQTMETFHSIGS